MKRLFILRMIVWTAACFAGHQAPAQNWSSNDVPNLSWSSVACSADGNKLVAAAFTSSIYHSTNAGLTWAATTSPTDGWSCVASSGDGTMLAATSYSATLSGTVYLSYDEGGSWTNTAVFGRFVSISADGQNLVALRNTGLVRVSTNAGNSWIAGGTLPSSQAWTSLRSSADGAKVVAAARSGKLYTSLDYGLNWVTNDVPNLPWSSVACTAEGTNWVATAGMKNGSPGPIYVSTNSGLTWTTTDAPVTNWVSVACSADGSRMFALVAGSAPSDPNPVYASTDRGATWTLLTAPKPWWSAIASSADGGKLVAVATGPIYTAASLIPPVLNVTKSGSNLVLGWTIPSSGFVLQETELLGNGWNPAVNISTPNYNNLQHEVTLNSTTEKSFYRLISSE